MTRIGFLFIYFNCHKFLAFQTDEEPEDYEWGSLCRLAELQRRNAATLPHLKSSYPIETQVIKTKFTFTIILILVHNIQDAIIWF